MVCTTRAANGAAWGMNAVIAQSETLSEMLGHRGIFAVVFRDIPDVTPKRVASVPCLYLNQGLTLHRQASKVPGREAGPRLIT